MIGHIRVMDRTSDDVLWRRTARGDEGAFAELFDRHALRIYAFCFRQTADWALAQDLTSVTFLEAWRRRRSVLVGEGKIVAWLFGVAYNVVRQQRRTLRRHQRALARLPALPPEPDHADDVAARVAAERRATEVLAALHRLPRAERAVITLIGLGGLSIAETAAALRVPEGTVRSRLYRARKRLDSSAEPAESTPSTLHSSVSTEERTV
jgi:RNA polymerase sigma factor (sigma-70 family)